MDHWITEEIKNLIKKRDNQKKLYEELANMGDIDGAQVAWFQYKKIRNSVNNRKKFEEKTFKSAKIQNSLEDPSDTWKVLKGFMNWKKVGGPLINLM